MTLLSYYKSLCGLPPTKNPAISSGGSDGEIINSVRQFFFDLVPEYIEPKPIPNIQSLGYVRQVNNYTDWLDATRNALPGDVIKLTATIHRRLQYRGSEAGSLGAGTARSGTPDAPITITADPGVWIDINYAAGQDSCLDVIRTKHVHTIGVNCRRAQFGIRYITCSGDFDNPIKIHHNETELMNDANIYVGCLSDANDISGEFYSVQYNRIHDSVGDVPYAEGIYIGTGSDSYHWRDQTRMADISFNHIWNMRGDGIDIKVGTEWIFAHHNLIHDCAGDLGAGISAAIPNSSFSPDPNPLVAKPIWIYNNWIYNIGYAFNNISNMAYGIRANMKSTLVFNNVLWSFAFKLGNTRGIDCSRYQDVDVSHTSMIFNNTIWVEDAIVQLNSGTYTGTWFIFENLTPDGTLGQAAVTSADFVGPIPVVNPSTESTLNFDANSGEGPGSGFVLAPGSGQINAAVNFDPNRSTDASGISVPLGGSHDRGAYEYIE